MYKLVYLINKFELIHEITFFFSQSCKIINLMLNRYKLIVKNWIVNKIKQY